MGTTRSSTEQQKSIKEPINTYIRRAKHSGSWYSSSPQTLDKELSNYLSIAANDDNGNTNTTTQKTVYRGANIPCAIIAPHAGYSYSGSTAAYAYIALQEALEQRGSNGASIQTIVVLHPSHYAHLDGCAVSGASTIETPLGNLQVDTTLRTKLLSSNLFTTMTQSMDETEHSGEMQYPYITKILNKVNQNQQQNNNNTTSSIRILPIMIGSLSKTKEQQYGQIFKPFIHQKHIFTIISSDFCHWGTRFQYTPYDKTTTTMSISSYIKWLDHLGMDKIQLKNPGAFADYLKKYSNTICGRHPISVWLFSVVDDDDVVVNFVKYNQSSEVSCMSDSSVSYASAVACWKK